MPGLVGVLDLEYSPDTLEAHELGALLERMCAIMTHEPWYQTHTYVHPPLAAGRVGLGIINPQPQPARTEDGSVLAWMDGEIYDHQRRALTQQLRAAGHQIHGEGDAELLAHRYEDLGEDCVQDLDGTFAVVIYDTRTYKLTIAVDREASRPLHFSVNGGRFTFASETSAVLEDERVPRQVDEQALVELFAFRHVLADRTLLRDVRFLPAGHLATVQDGQVQVRPYWIPVVTEDQPPLPHGTYVEEIVAALRRALERQMYDQRPIGEHLSGGLDSRTLAGLFPPDNGSLHTFTRGPVDCWDVRFGAMVAQRVGSQHHSIELAPDFLLRVARKGVWITGGLMTVNDMYVLGIIEQVKPHVDVVFMGQGRGDPIFDGIGINGELLAASTLDEAAEVFSGFISASMPPSIRARVLRGPFYQRTRGLALDALRQALEQCDGERFYERTQAFCLQHRWPRSHWGALLSRTQVETRAPYSDNEFCDLVCRVPARWRADEQMHRAVLKRARPDLARVPWATTGLPASLSTPGAIFVGRAYFRLRREISFLTRGRIAPLTTRNRAYYATWYRTVLRPWLEGILLDERTLGRGYYDPEGTRALVEEHMSGRRDRSVQFGLLLAFELWNRLFIDGEKP